MALTISSFWIGERLGGLGRLSIESFLQNGFEYQLFVYKPPSDLPSAVIVRDATEYLPVARARPYSSGPGAGSFSLASNLFRYELLYSEGGIWADTDLICLRPFSFGEIGIGFAQERTRSSVQIATCLLATPPRHAFAASCLQELQHSDLSQARWGELGPTLATKVVRELGLESHANQPNSFCPIDWWDYDQLFTDFELTIESVAIHCWGEMWRRSGRDRDGEHTGLYRQLYRRFR